MTSEDLVEPADPGLRERLCSRLALARRVFRAHPTMPATAFWRIFEAEVIPPGLVARGRGLDVGCGDGSFASVVFPAASGVAWTGLEPDPVDADLARASGRYQEVRVARGEEMPFDAECFDMVFSNCVLEHVGDLDALLAQVGRVLRPGGRFLFTVPSEGFYEALLLPRLLRRLGFTAARERYVGHLQERLELVNLLTAEQWHDRLRACGLSVRSEVPYATRRAASCWELVANLTGGLAYWVARGRTSPRRIQQSTGLLSGSTRWLGDVFLVLLSPFVAFTALQRGGTSHAGRFVVAVKEPGAG